MSAPNTLAEFNALLEPMRLASDVRVKKLVEALETTMLAHLAMQKIAEVQRPLVPHRLNGKVVGWWFAEHTAATPVEAVLGTGDI